jgi:hypothetical protein
MRTILLLVLSNVFIFALWAQTSPSGCEAG